MKYILEEVDENWNKFVILRENSNYYTMYDNDNLISDFFKISRKNYQSILKSTFENRIIIDNFTSLFDKSIKVDDIVDAIDIAKVTAIMFGEEEEKVKRGRYNWYRGGVDGI